MNKLTFEIVNSVGKFGLILSYQLMDASTFALLADPAVREAFKKLLRFRILPFYELEKDTSNVEELKKALQALQSKGLIEKQTSGFSDLDKYFLTREGLEAEKMVAK